MKIWHRGEAELCILAMHYNKKPFCVYLISICNIILLMLKDDFFFTSFASFPIFLKPSWKIEPQISNHPTKHSQKTIGIVLVNKETDIVTIHNSKKLHKFLKNHSKIKSISKNTEY